MSEETKVTTPTETATAPAAASTDGAATEPQVNPGLEWLNTASPDEILKNDRIRGIFGSRIQQEREQIRQQMSAEQDRAARQKAEQDLLNLAKSDPFTFAQTYLSKAEQERLQNETQNLKQSARVEFVQQIGRGYAALPEWQNLTPAEQETLARSVMGKSDDEALISFNAAALDVIAERRANAKAAKFRESELAKEREAIRQEETAKRVKTSARPSLDRGATQPQGGDWQSLPPGKDFNKAYEEFVLGRRR